MTDIDLSRSAAPLHAPKTDLALAWAVLAEPTRAFGALKERPTFWFALLVPVIASAAFFLVYYARVDVAWLTDHLLNADAHARELSDTGKAVATEAVSKSLLLWTSLATVVLGAPLLKVLESTYYLLAGRSRSIRLSFRHWMALSCWSAWPLLLLVVVMFATLFLHADGQVAQEQTNLLSLNELLFHVGAANRWHALLSTLTVLHPWAWWLTVVGVRTWTLRSTAFSAVFALLPVAVVYGGWALLALVA
jgi:hypothetical protein